jgi:hypothetical protein
MTACSPSLLINAHVVDSYSSAHLAGLVSSLHFVPLVSSAALRFRLVSPPQKRERR